VKCRLERANLGITREIGIIGFFSHTISRKVIASDVHCMHGETSDMGAFINAFIQCFESFNWNVVLNQVFFDFMTVFRFVF
jgi:hypothetical protein